MNNINRFLIILLATIWTNIMYAYDIEVDGLFYDVDLSTMEAVVVNNHEKKYEGDIVIPSEILYNTKKFVVKKIGENAFWGCDLQSVLLPNSIIEVGAKAFYKNSCSSIIIEDGSTPLFIKKGYDQTDCFSTPGLFYCGRDLSYEPSRLFFTHDDYDYQRVNKVIIGKNVTSFGSKNISMYCDSLIIQDGNSQLECLSTYSYYVYLGRNLTSSSNLVDPDTNVRLYNAKIGDNVTIIESNIFRKNIIPIIELPPNLIEICDNSFNRSLSVNIIEIPNNVKKVGVSAFSGCDKLETVIIGRGIQQLGKNAFNSDNITTVISKIRNPNNCVPNESTNNLYFFSNKTYLNATLYVPRGTIDKYRSTIGWKEFVIIEEMDFEEPNLYTLKYIVDNEVYKLYEIEEGESISPEPEPTKEGYTFSGWSEIPETMPAMDVTVTGSFTINKYKLIYMVDGAEYKNYDLEYGSAITPEPAPTKEGYTFSGWSDIPSTMPAKDVIVTGSFTKNAENTYTLKYVVDGEVYKIYQLQAGEAITPEPEPTKEGYTFSGWSDIPKTMPDYDVTVTGTFTKDEDVRKFESGGICYNVNDNGTSVTVTSGSTKYQGNITIPSSVSYNGKNYDVTSIGYGAFGDCTGLTSISIPNSVMYIQYGAFQNCSSLISITLPNSIQSIGQYAFMGCYGLTKIVSEIESPFSLEGSTFENSTFNSATLIVPVGTKAVYQSKGGWMNFKNIVEAGQGGEIGHVFFFDGIYYWILDYNSVCVTHGSNEYKGDIAIPSQIIYNGKTYTVTSIGVEAFECSNLTSIIIPGSVTEIGGGAFRECSGLKSITIPNSVKCIWEEAFADCSSLTSIIIPNSVTNIGFAAFYGCDNLITVESHIVNPFDIYVNTFGDDTYKKAELLVPPSVKLDYESKTGWNLFSKITEADNYGYDFVAANADGVMIYYNYINDGKELEVVYDPNCLISTRLGENSDWDYMLNHSYTVDVVAIPEDVTYLNKTMKVTSVGSYAFSGCNLSSVLIPASMKTLGTYCFNNCYNLRKVYCYALEPPSLLGKKHFEFDIDEPNWLHVPAEAIDAYKSSDWNQYFQVFVPIEETGINTVSYGNKIKDIYSINGERRDTVSKGINIIKMGDGKIIKVLIK